MGERDRLSYTQIPRVCGLCGVCLLNTSSMSKTNLLNTPFGREPCFISTTVAQNLTFRAAQIKARLRSVRVESYAATVAVNQSFSSFRYTRTARPMAASPMAGRPFHGGGPGSVVHSGRVPGGFGFFMFFHSDGPNAFQSKIRS